MKKGFITGLLLFVFFIIIYAGATNFDRLVLGSGNYSTDPNSTADITLQNDEYISNAIDGRLDMGAANLLTSGTIGGGAITGTSLVSTGAITGSSVSRGTNVFTTTATADTVTISGAGTGDVYAVNYTAAAAATEAPLSVVSTATGFIVTRPAGTTSAITYSWIRFK